MSFIGFTKAQFKSLDDLLGSMLQRIKALEDGGGGGGGTDISLGISGASVGQVPSVGSVDGSGKPTSWDAYSASLGTVGYVVTDGNLAITLDGSTDAVDYTVTNGDLGITVTVTLS